MPIPIVQPDPLVPSTNTASLYLGSSEYIKKAMLFALRQAFNHPYTPVDYHYDSDEKKRQISIYRGYPKKVIQFPCIIIETRVADGSITSLGNEEGQPQYDSNNVQTGQLYWGTLMVPTVLTVLTNTPTDREKVGDLLYIYVRSIFRDFFYRQRMPFLKIDAGADGEVLVENKNRFLYRVEMNIQSEFNYIIDYSLLELFKDVDLQGLLFGTNKDDLQPDSE